RSTSYEGQGLVIITFELSKNGDVAAQEVQNKVNLIVNDLPQTAKTPVVQKFDPDATPILQVAVSAPRSLRDVTLIADKQIKQKLENARGVGQITIVGGALRASARLNGVPPVTLVVAKQPAEITVTTANEVKQRLKQITATLPRDIKTQVIGDQSIFIEAAVDSIKHHLIEGSIFASVII